MAAGCHFSQYRTMPGDSPGIGRPVRAPNPKRFTYSHRRLLPTLRPIWMAPILLDLASTSSTERDAYELWSWMTRLKSVIRPLPQGMMVRGVIFVVSSPAATVMTLKTDPGSKGADT